jgi:hypothetical protein
MGNVISNCPELHRHDLENQLTGETPEEKGDEQSFHFSLLNDGDYWFFYFFNTENPQSRRQVAASRSAAVESWLIAAPLSQRELKLRGMWEVGSTKVPEITRLCREWNMFRALADLCNGYGARQITFPVLG